MTTTTSTPRVAHLDTRGPYDLREVAMMGFGHRDEQSFDGVMRLAFCVDGSPGRPDYAEQVGVELRQDGSTLEVTVHDPAGQEADLDVVTAQVARVVSVDHDGEAFGRMCRSEPPLARLYEAAPGFRPALFYSPYEAAVWSVISARRPRAQGIRLRARLAEAYGCSFELAGQPVVAVPTPSVLRTVDGLPGLPTDRIPRLHAIAEAAEDGLLSVDRLTSMPPDEAEQELRKLPGIGPFYSTLVVVRACGLADVLAAEESRSRAAVQELYGLDHEPSDSELAQIAERWRPFRTWATVMVRAVAERKGVAAVA